MKISFSVAMCVYGGDNSTWFDKALESVTVNQNVKPNELVLVVDGPITDEIEKVIQKYTKIVDSNGISFTLYRFFENKGHGNARRKSIELCNCDYIALMDSDDISVPTRFEQQLLFLSKNNADIVGGNVSEFIERETNIVSRRIVPERDLEIKLFSKKRFPMNQVTVMFKKEAYLDVGGYIDWFCEEDYYLWLRMILSNKFFANLPVDLVKVRVGKDMYKRRGGLRYFRSEKKLQKYMLKNKIITFPRYLLNVFERFVVQVLLPSKIRGWVFRKMARA